MARWGLWTHGSKLPCIVETLAFQSILGRNPPIVLWDLGDLVDNFWWTKKNASFSIWLHKALLSSASCDTLVGSPLKALDLADSDAPFRRILSWHGPTVTWQLKKVTTKLYTQKYQKMYEVEIIWNNCHRKEAFRILKPKNGSNGGPNQAQCASSLAKRLDEATECFTSWNMTPSTEQQ